ncbi:DNA repair protein RAD50 [Nakaseomyces bracarensis]|uniref:DNA repair protein RAD50 n=1 Tax=Nakaseomyces bracarensis TaxID=273131 RepID=A0ABR4NYV8_9SACH
MSAIYKLSIQGIRSFDSNDRETIEFGKPLTLIVGTNGSGKTTIIECLKYATTGDLPPNSKGGVFVHDPKITGEKDVRAQVKLAFTSTNGLTMIVTRNIQLLAKRTTTTFKTLEGQLVAINRNNDRTTLSTRSADLDSQVPLYLGVPKAILEYVIFCHQEDSLWPLSEPSNLKKKFDEIFQAMKFTKALDNLKIIKKDMAINIKLLAQSVEHLRIDRDRSRATKLRMKQLNDKIDEYNKQVNSVETELEDINDKLDKLFKSNQNFQKVLSRIDNLNTIKQNISTQLERLTNTIDLISIPKEEIQQLLTNFSTTLDRKEAEVKKIQEHLKTNQSTLDELQKRSQKLLIRQGELKAKKNQYETNKEIFDQLVSKFGVTYHISPDIDDSVTMQKINEEKTRIEDDLASLQKSNNSKKNACQDKLRDVQRKLESEQEKISYLNEDIEKFTKDNENLKQKFQYAPAKLEELLTQEKEKLNINNEDLQKFEVNNNITDLNNDIAQKTKDLSEYEDALQKIEDAINEFTKQSDLVTKSNFINMSIDEKSANCNKLKKELVDDHLFSKCNLSSDENLCLDYKSHFINLQKKIAINIQQHNESTKEYTEFKYEHDNNLKQLKELSSNETAILKRINDKMPEDCSIDDYDDVLMETEVSYKNALENLKMHQTTLEFNRKALQVAKDRDCCYLCSRKFETADFRGKILAELNAKTDTEFELSLKKTVNEEKEYLDILRELEKDIYAYNQIIENKNSTTLLIKKSKVKVDDCLQNVNRIDETGKLLKEEREHYEEHLKPKLDKYEYLMNEIENLKTEKNNLDKSLREILSGTNGNTSIDKLQEEKKTTRQHIWDSRKAIEKLQKKREEIRLANNSLIEKIRSITKNVTDLEQKALFQRNLEEQIKKNTENIRNNKESIEKSSDILKTLESKLAEKEDENKSILQQMEEEEQRKYLDLQNLMSQYNQINDTYRQLSNFSTSEKEDLIKCEKELTSINVQLESLKQEIESQNKHYNSESQKLHDSTSEKRNLIQNIEFIELNEQLVTVNNELEQLKEQNAEAERDKYQEESARLRTQYERLSAQNAGKLGEIKQLQNQIDTLTQQLRTDYKDVDEKYQKEWVELQARSFANDDIDTYSKALDSAIMKYHSLKMEDINRIIDELWKRTYTGTDIDTIKISSDEVGTSVKGKSYNYRVVMFKQDAELDMRGRCSAGQKVLASIIIRLALSETFGINCGVIALDEPTTNLDEENIESLAKSLHNIIEFRKHQKNFQLIVITHDEKFLNHMNAARFTDHFFRVKRDDRLKSLIEWVDIAKVTE